MTAGRTQWGPAGLIMVAALVAVVGVAQLVQSRVLTASFALGGVPLQLTIPEVDANGLALFGTSLPVNDGSVIDAVTFGIEQGLIDDVCVTLPIPSPGGTFALRARGPVTEVTGLALDTNAIAGSTLDFEGIVIGRDAANLTSGGITGTPGENGIEAERLVATDLGAQVFNVTAATFDMTALQFEVVAATQGCG